MGIISTLGARTICGKPQAANQVGARCSYCLKMCNSNDFNGDNLVGSRVTTWLAVRAGKRKKGGCPIILAKNERGEGVNVSHVLLEPANSTKMVPTAGKQCNFHCMVNILCITVTK